MTSRRKFLEMLGLTTATVVAPKFIFDMGANLYKRAPFQGEVGYIGGGITINRIKTLEEVVDKPLGSIKIDGEEYHRVLLSPSAIYDLINDMTQPVDEEFYLGQKW